MDLAATLRCGRFHSSASEASRNFPIAENVFAFPSQRRCVPYRVMVIESYVKQQSRVLISTSRHKIHRPLLAFDNGHDVRIATVAISLEHRLRVRDAEKTHARVCRSGLVSSPKLFPADDNIELTSCVVVNRFI